MSLSEWSKHLPNRVGVQMRLDFRGRSVWQLQQLHLYLTVRYFPFFMEIHLTGS